MARIGTAYVDVKGDFSSLNRGISGVSNKLKTAFGVGAAAGLAGAIAGVTKATVGFDRSMRNVNSIAQLNDKQFKKLSKSVLGLAGPTAQAPKTLADGLYDLVSSGFDAEQSLHILGASAKAATAGLTTTETSTRAVAAVLNAYHRPASEAAKISDELFQTVNKGVITFDELASNIGDVLPFSAALGVNLSGVGAAISTMTKAGISAPETMTRIKSIMQSLIAPSDALQQALSKVGVKGAQELIKRFGGGREGLQGALEALIKTTDGSQEALAKLFPNVRALGGALALTGKNADGANKDLEAFRKVTGATDKALKEQQKSVSFQFNKLKATVSAIAISVGSVLVPALSKGLLKLSGWASDAADAFGELKKRYEGLRVDGRSPLASIGKIVADGITGIDWRSLGEKMSAGLSAALDFSSKLTPAITAGLAAAVSQVNGEQVLGKLVDILGEAIEALFSPSFWIEHFAAIFSIVTLVIPIGKILKIPGFNFLFKFISAPFFKAITLLGRGMVSLFSKVAKEGLLGFLAGLDQFAPRLVTAILSLVGKMSKPFSRLVGVLRGVATTVGNALAGGLGAVAGRIGEAAGRLAGRMVKPLHDLGARMFQLGANLVQGLINGIASKAGAIVKAVKEFITDKLPGYVKKALGILSPSTVFYDIGVNVSQGLIDGLKSQSAKVAAAAADSLLFPIEAQIAKLEAQRDKLQASYDKADTRRQRADLQAAIKNAKAEVTAIAAAAPKTKDLEKTATDANGKIVELLWRVKGHFDHLHVAMSSGIGDLGRKLQKMGYSVSENPEFGGVGGGHVKGSFHYSGKAIDVNADNAPGGEAAALDKLAAMLRGGGVKGLKVKGGDGASIADAVKALKDFEREQVRIKNLATIDLKVKGLEQLKNWRDALDGISTDLKGKVSDALDEFSTHWEDTIGKALDAANEAALDAFDAATQSAIENGPAAQRLRELQAQADQISGAAEDASNQKALKQALNSGTRADVAAAQAAIDETARQRAIAQAQVDAEREKESFQAFRDAQREALEIQQQVDRQARLDADTAAFQKSLDDQLTVEYDQLAKRKQNYAKFAKDVNAILKKYGVATQFDTSYDIEAAINAGPAPKKRHSGGSVQAGLPYIVGGRGAEELFVPSSGGQITPMGGGSGGGNVVVQGDLVVQDASDSDRLARLWAWQIETAIA